MPNSRSGNYSIVLYIVQELYKIQTLTKLIAIDVPYIKTQEFPCVKNVKTPIPVLIIISEMNSLEGQENNIFHVHPQKSKIKENSHEKYQKTFATVSK